VYTWNHLSPLLTAATSSIERVPIVDSDHGTPARAAARATASSPWEWAIRVNPVGARISGIDTAVRPKIVVDVSTRLTSRRMRGWNS
jgi:hypothetical protein